MGVGESSKTKILEELISNWDFFLSADEISGMLNVSKGVYNFLDELNRIGLLVIENNDSN